MSETGWLEVSIIVDGELAEAVAEVLARYTKNGVVIESTAIDQPETGAGTAVGPMRVCAYLPADEEVEDKKQRLLEALWHLGQIQPLPEPEFKHIENTNWMQAWKANYKPIVVGQGLVVLPAWMDAADSERVPIRIDPGMAFGTGTHPTTQLALMLMETHLQKGQAAIDIGCGSGILSIAAAKLGAGDVLGVDIDAEAVENAQNNLLVNDVTEQVTLAVGSVPEVMAGQYAIKQAPLVVANMLAHLLLKVIDQGLIDLVAQQGILILSGILDEREAEINHALEKQGFVVVERLEDGDWVGFAARQKED
ncbi:MAG: 50S ribosomal protein L11 methyltransferase [Chloroflexi bacterium]|nr:MAG: 50S ribosomal protein L11 methyltransferase [Chloroflexota bacterium]MBL1193949.1 50S ribosomal protein L11 methyltransferase [Chloroflexota bacterium]NOH11243.1 50S ribosomal protein L11 methyltransferase [Chloroflexota bacterium]